MQTVIIMVHYKRHLRFAVSKQKDLLSSIHKNGRLFYKTAILMCLLLLRNGMG